MLIEELERATSKRYTYDEIINNNFKEDSHEFYVHLYAELSCDKIEQDFEVSTKEEDTIIKDTYDFLSKIFNKGEPSDF